MIAITGAAGFIGSNLAHRLAKTGHHLFLIDHPLSAAKSANWAGLERFCFATDSYFLQALREKNLRIAAVLLRRLQQYDRNRLGISVPE